MDQIEAENLCRFMNEKGLNANIAQAEYRGKRNVHYFSLITSTRCKDLCDQTKHCNLMEVKMNWDLVNYGACSLVWHPERKSRKETESEKRAKHVAAGVGFFTRRFESLARHPHHIKPIVDAEKLVRTLNEKAKENFLDAFNGMDLTAEQKEELKERNYKIWKFLTTAGVDLNQVFFDLTDAEIRKFEAEVAVDQHYGLDEASIFVGPLEKSVFKNGF